MIHKIPYELTYTLQEKGEENGKPLQYSCLEKPMNSMKRQKDRTLKDEPPGHSKHPLPTTQEKTLHMDITRWSTLKSD